MEKQYISAGQLLDDSFRLGLKILESGFRPHFIVGIWRGGAPVGITVQELLDFFGIPTDHIAIRTSLYTGIGERDKQIRVHGLQYVIDNVDADEGLLIVDDVYDTGLSIAAVIESLEARARRNTPRDIRVATAYFKPASNRTDRVPDYYIHETDKWLVFPHELNGISPEELLENKPGIESIVDKLRSLSPETGR
ncbi:MAG: hypoxanthine phosphoribosyltransferase [Gammaproteobacteria bacterium]|nr:hypoxanthine phosphoribosyltransferase [Gammaproteobacteria bacterium]NIM73982.1 hypoxanthine phosphoribosyltransferase [Gammaproteobacteria bacterium]NIN38863.1 hypoxanthine phosphoribosyltransferase [Gammaproteobacteria bacterium]NIO25758.1 hypoxanthine phosphoribosyltransferase [Gammaproteobacteria bacterium]NIO66388.1 hypoxanthine phosphoribosyltransferase [Gammaproteobacteria bacterium]